MSELIKTSVEGNMEVKKSPSQPATVNGVPGLQKGNVGPNGVDTVTFYDIKTNAKSE